MRLTTDPQPNTITGVDLSLTSTGVAILRPEGWVWCNPKTTGHRHDPWNKKTTRIHGLIQEIAARIPANCLLVVEGPSFNSISTSAWERAALFYGILQAGIEKNCALGIVPPTVLKQWATGAGNTSKQPIIDIAQQFTSTPMPNDDVADATILALMGAHRMGIIDPPGGWRHQCLMTAKWEPDYMGQWILHD